MRRSMTAYGHAILQTKKTHWIVEVTSLNRKGLDIHIMLPHALLFLDPIVRKWVGKVSARGSITVRVICESKDNSHLIQRLKQEKSRWEKIADTLKMSRQEITLSFLLSQTTQQEVVLDKVLFEQELRQVWEHAAQMWIAMKEQEGKHLIQDIHHRLKVIRKELRFVGKDLSQLLKKHLSKLSDRMEELKLTVDAQQLEKEAVFLFNREDITEEIVRLKSHMEQMELYLQSPEESVGRTLDFLAQEMGREIGTLMAKTGSLETARRAVVMKSEIEKIREQIQNIE